MPIDGFRVPKYPKAEKTPTFLVSKSDQNVVGRSIISYLLPPMKYILFLLYIVRRFMSAKLYQSPEMIIQAETRFAESPFVIECLEWHNSFRKRHLAPELSLDPLVTYSYIYLFDLV